MTLRNRRGNILFLILLAVVLFAALAYAVTSSLRGGGKDGSGESATAAAADIMGWLKQVDRAVMRMMLVGNVPLEKLDFYDGANMKQGGVINYTNNSYCAVGETYCMVFHQDGGAVAPRNFEQYANMARDVGDTTNRKPGHRTIMTGKIQDVGTPLNEVILRISYIKLPICQTINRMQGLPDCPGVNQLGSLTEFQGDFNAITAALADTTAYAYANDVRGRTTFCSCDNTREFGNIYHVVVER